jgi:hypothetical protein
MGGRQFVSELAGKAGLFFNLADCRLLIRLAVLGLSFRKSPVVIAAL